MKTVTPVKQSSLKDLLFRPVASASLGFFRILLGVMMLWQLFRIEPYIVDRLTQSQFFLTYDFFHWIKIGSQPTMGFLFFLMKFLCILITLGVFYRLATTLLFFGWTYILLLDIGHYNNHYYLYSLLLFLMIFNQADEWGSVKNLLKKKKAGLIPNWQILILKAQVFIVYFYGGLAKLEYDWFNGYPMKIWMYFRSDYPIIGPFLATDFFAYFISWSGVIFDLSIGFLLLYKRTRKWVLFPLALFHISNSFLWTIGSFPWFMLGATILFFDPDLPQQWVNWFQKNILKSSSIPKPLKTNQLLTNFKNNNWIIYPLGFYLLFQLLFPFRQWLYPDKTSWHGQGQLFAWRMMLVDRAEAIKVKVGFPNEGIVGQVQLDEYVNHRQFQSMPKTPKTLHRFAHFIKKEIAENANREDAEVYVVLWRQLNSRPYQLLLDSTINLANLPYSEYQPVEYIHPFKNLPYKKELNTFEEEERTTMGLSY